MPRAGRKYAPLLEDPDFGRWVKNITRGSPVTAEVTVKRLQRACELMFITPKEMVERAKIDLKGFQDALEDMVAAMEEEEKSPGYIPKVS